MKTKIDELLNRYIDNELDTPELTGLDDLIDKDPEALKELKAMKLVEKSLKKMEYENAPLNTTYTVMLKIASAKKIKRSNWFFWTVVSFFSLCIAAVLIYSFSIYSPSASEISSGGDLNAVKNFFSDKAKSINKIFSGEDIKLLGAVISLLLIVTGYFILESHRNLKNKLKSL